MRKRGTARWAQLGWRLAGLAAAAAALGAGNKWQ